MSKLSREKLMTLGIEKLADIIEKESEVNVDFKKQLTLVLNASLPDKIFNHLRADIKAIAKSQHFIHWKESGAFSQTLRKILSGIQDHFLPQNPNQAITILDLFLSLGNNVMNRCDDSNGNMGDVFRDAVNLWGDAWENLPSIDGNTLALTIWEYMQKNNFGLVDNIIPACADALKRQGLEELEMLAKNFAASNGSDSFIVYHVLRDTAMLRESPEALRSAFKLTNHIETLSDQINIAKLLIKAQRNIEAIALLESMDDTMHYGYESLDLLIEIYASENNQEKAQELRWRGFTTRNNLKYYYDYTKQLVTDEDKEKALNAAIELAVRHNNCITAMQLLNDLGFPEKSAHILHERYSELSGNQYYLLLDVAKHFEQKKYPLEAIIIYRRLTEDILERAQSKYYHHAINYLKKSKELSPQIHNWLNYPITALYFNQLKKEHSRKAAFLKAFLSIEKDVLTLV